MDSCPSPTDTPLTPVSLSNWPGEKTDPIGKTEAWAELSIAVQQEILHPTPQRVRVPLFHTPQHRGAEARLTKFAGAVARLVQVARERAGRLAGAQAQRANAGVRPAVGAADRAALRAPSRIRPSLAAMLFGSTCKGEDTVSTGYAISSPET